MLIAGLILIDFVIVGLSIGLGYRAWWVKQQLANFSPQPNTFELKPPVQAMVGVVNKQGELKQGDSWETDATSSAEIDFAGIAKIRLGNNTSVAAADTIPSEFLLVHQGGEATYETVGPTVMAVRGLHAVVEMASASATLTFVKGPKIMIKVHQGSVKVGYQDEDHKSYVKEVMAGQSFRVK
jgi:hypothetical protein